MENQEKKISIRLYKSGDENMIFSLFEIVFHKKMDPLYWKWMYQLNPAGKGIIALAFHEEKLVSHYSVTPINVTLKGNDIKAVFSLDTMTHPDYRGLGLFPKLAEFVYAEAVRLDYQIVFGFPNHNSYSGFIKKLGWYGSGNMSLYSIPTSNAQYFAQHDIIIKKIHKLTPKSMRFIEQLWNKVKRNYFFSINRSGLYIKWRYFDRPGVKYELYVIQSETEILGYFILKIFSSSEEIKGHIIDFFIEDNAYFSDIMNFSLNFFKNQNLSLVTFWCNQIYGDLLQFKKIGVKKELMEKMFFGFRSLTDITTNTELAENFNGFYLVMGNCDVF